MTNMNASAKNKIQLAQTHSLNKGLRLLGDKGKKAAYQEMNQIHKRTTFEPVRKEESDSPTAATVAILIAGVIEAKEERDVSQHIQRCASRHVSRNSPWGMQILCYLLWEEE